MTLEDSMAEANRILREAGWHPHPEWSGEYVRLNLVGGIQPDRQGVHLKDYTKIMPGHPLYSADTPDEPHEAAQWLVDRFGAQPAAKDDFKTRLRKLLKEKAHAEIPRPVHDGSASAGDGAGSESTAAADHPDPAGSGPGLASAQDQPEDQSSAANASKPPVDADFSEPSDPSEPPVDDSAGQAGDTIIEGHKPAEPPAYGGTLIDDTRERLAAQVDEEAKPRLEAQDTIIRNTPMQEINNARMMGVVTDEQAAAEAAYYAAGSRRLAIVETARKLKEQVWKATPEMLAKINPADPSLWT